MAKSDRLTIFIQKHENKEPWANRMNVQEKRKKLLEKLKNKTKNRPSL